MFQSTHLHEVWHCRFALLLPKMPVSIHTPTWGVTCMSSIVCKFRSFQSTHLHEVWLITKVHRLFLESFNPHTYMRCDYSTMDKKKITYVSIHTPTWGVTSEVWHSTLNSTFQSTHLHEVWLCDRRSIRLYGAVSIHTPTWGVTLQTWIITQQEKSFQSTHLHEVWPTTTSGQPLPLKFQSTHLHEVWHNKDIAGVISSLFQSTHLHEVWLLNSYLILGQMAFQSTHLHEVWHKQHVTTVLTIGVSIHTPTWGVTTARYYRSNYRSFNPHTYMRCDNSTLLPF